MMTRYDCYTTNDYGLEKKGQQDYYPCYILGK